MPVKHVLLKFDLEDFDKLQNIKPSGWTWEKFVMTAADQFKKEQK